MPSETCFVFNTALIFQAFSCSSREDCLSSSRNLTQCSQQGGTQGKKCFGTGEGEASRYIEFVDTMQADAGTVVIPRNFKLLEELEAGMAFLCGASIIANK